MSVTTDQRFKLNTPDKGSIVHLGGGRDRITLFKGDYVNNGCRCMFREEELPSPLPEGEMLYYAFTLEMPNDWPTGNVARDALVAQWRNGDGSPLISIHCYDDTMLVYWNIESPPQKFRMKMDMASENKIIVQAKWSRDDDGYFKATLNGVVLAEFTGRTMNLQTGKIYASFGAYRPAWNGSKGDYSSGEYMALIFSDVDYGIGVYPGEVVEPPPPVEPPVKPDACTQILIQYGELEQEVDALRGQVAELETENALQRQTIAQALAILGATP